MNIYYKIPKLKKVRKFGPLPALTNKKVKNSSLPLKNIKTKNKIKWNHYSNFSLQLKEKQKLRFNYGISEKQLRNYFQKARLLSTKFKTIGFILFQYLELRLDILIYRLGFAPTIPAARQLINHGAIFINDKSTNISSFNCNINDIISVSPNIKFIELIKQNLNKKNIKLPSFLSLDKTSLIGKVLNFPSSTDFLIYIKTRYIVEYYSRYK